jgi:hypothetical protein
MLMKKLIVLSLILLVILVGCKPAVEKPVAQQQGTELNITPGTVVQVSKSQIKFKIDVPEDITVEPTEQRIEPETVNVE